MNSKLSPLRSNSYFDAYLEYHHISLLLAAQLAGIRPIELWRIQHDLPVCFSVAASLRIALFKRTGVPYLAPIFTRPENQSNQLKKEYSSKEKHMMHAFSINNSGSR